MIHLFPKRCTSSTPRSARWRRGWTTCQWRAMARTTWTRRTRSRRTRRRRTRSRRRHQRVKSGQTTPELRGGMPSASQSLGGSRVAKYQGFWGLIPIKMFAGWGKKFEKYALLPNQAFLKRFLLAFQAFHAKISPM